MNATTTTTVAIVTGAGGVIGRAIATQLAHAGDTVVCADIDTEAAEATRAQLPARVKHSVLRVDMSDNLSVRALVDDTVAEHGRIDHVVNNAAVNHRGSLRDFDPDLFDHMMAVNLRGPAVLAQAAAPVWDRQHAETGSRGALVNIASRAWVAGGPIAYAACKAGIVGVTRSLARELAPCGVTSNAIAPGLVPSAFTRDGRSDELFDQLTARSIAATPLGRLTAPEDVAHTAAFLCSPGAAYITAEVVHVCGGSQLAPLGGANTR